MRQRRSPPPPGNGSTPWPLAPGQPSDLGGKDARFHGLRHIAEHVGKHLAEPFVGAADEADDLLVQNVGTTLEIALLVLLAFALLLAQYDVAGHLFVRTGGIEAVGAGQVNDLYFIALAQVGKAGFLVYGHPRKVAHFLVHTGKTVEQGAFTAVGVAYKGYM